MTKIQRVESWLESNAGAYADPHKLAAAAEAEFGVGIYVDPATPARSHLSGVEGRKQRSTHGFNVHYKRQGVWVRDAGWVYLSAAALAQ